MNRVHRLYELWSQDPYFDEETRKELRELEGQEAEIEERFYRSLSFGTAGLRGILGAGTNRMNTYTVAQATEGFARYIESLGAEACQRGMVISYDCRICSPEFALTTALVFASHGIHVRLVDELRPTPMLSFAVRHYNCVGGVMVTASHNPPQYNGYKAYGEDGGQLAPEAADQVTALRDAISDIREVHWISEAEALDKGLLEYVGEDLDTAYMATLKPLVINWEAIRSQADMKIVYTPLHGAGNKPVRRILQEVGFRQVLVVPEQERPDGRFPTVKSPNPEVRSALEMGIALAEREGAELVIATDPDGDRTGLVIRLADGRYQVMTGNQIGILLMDYILRAKQAAGTLSDKSFCVTTVVSGRLPRLIAQHYGVQLFECLTGFKWIADLIKQYDEHGDMHFEFGFEESFGYLSGTAVRDKDAVVTSMLLAEMAASVRAAGKTLADSLQELYARYGYAEEETISVVREGKSGMELMARAMEQLRERQGQAFPGLEISSLTDLQQGRQFFLAEGREAPIDLPRSNVLIYSLDGINFFCVRPSGTEPKIKIYFGVYGSDQQGCREQLEALKQQVMAVLEGLLAV